MVKEIKFGKVVKIYHEYTLLGFNIKYCATYKNEHGGTKIRIGDIILHEYKPYIILGRNKNNKITLFEITRKSPVWEYYDHRSLPRSYRAMAGIILMLMN